MKGFIARLTMGGLVMASGLSAASAVQARCVTDRFSFGYGVARASARWLIAKDADCMNVLTTGGVTILERLSIARPAQHGAAGVASRYRFAYKPAAGFVGKDSFAVKIDFDYRGRREATLVEIDVTVR